MTDILLYKDAELTADRYGIKQALHNMGQETCLAVLEYRQIKGQLPEADAIRNVLEDILLKQEPWNLSQLAVDGSDLIRAGVPEGEKVGKILKIVLQKVMQSPTLNNKEYLCSGEFLSEVENEFSRSI